MPEAMIKKTFLSKTEKLSVKQYNCSKKWFLKKKVIKPIASYPIVSEYFTKMISRKVVTKLFTE